MSIGGVVQSTPCAVLELPCSRKYDCTACIQVRVENCSNSIRQFTSITAYQRLTSAYVHAATLQSEVVSLTLLPLFIKRSFSTADMQSTALNGW